MVKRMQTRRKQKAFHVSELPYDVIDELGRELPSKDRKSAKAQTRTKPPVPVLPDFLTQRLDVVFCGTAAGNRSAKLDHFFAGRGNRFWEVIHDAGFTTELLTPERDSEVTYHRIGLTDLVKHRAMTRCAAICSTFGHSRTRFADSHRVSLRSTARERRPSTSVIAARKK